MSDQHMPLQDMEPDLAEVQQVEPPDIATVPVRIEGPIESRELPSKRIATRTVAVSATVGSMLLSHDPRRKSATIVARSQDILIGASQAQSQLNGAWWPGVIPFVITSVTEVWAIGDGGNTDVSIVEEYWA